MAEEKKPVDTKPPDTGADQPPAASSPAPTDDIKILRQKYEGLESDVRALKQQNTDLATENATIRATVKDIEVGDSSTSDDIAEVSISEADAERIAEITRDDPKKGAQELADLNAKLLHTATQARERIQKRTEKTASEINAFVENIYKEKPNLRQYDRVLYDMATSRQRQSGKTYESILSAVKELESIILAKVPAPAPPPGTPESPTTPPGAQGESGAPTAPEKLPEQEADTQTQGEFIAEREKNRNQKIFRSVR